jgi:fermentation-respiration switch protein FrsA (DUF1100 family)
VKKKLGAAFLTGALAFIAISLGSAWQLTRGSHRSIGAPPPELGATEVTFVSQSLREGRAKAGVDPRLSLSGWYSPPRAGFATVVLLHGYRGDRIIMLPRALWLHSLGFGVLLYDARGCGESEGQLRSVGYYETADLMGALAFLKAKGNGPLEAIGVSQGGATILLASEHLPTAVRGVVCESVYDELSLAVDRRYRSRFGIPGWLGGALMVPIAEHRLGLKLADVRPVEHVGQLACPLLMLAGDRDDRTWPQDTRRLYAAAREPKQLWLVPGATHEDLFAFAGQAYKDRVLAFLMHPAIERVTNEGAGNQR